MIPVRNQVLPGAAILLCFWFLTVPGRAQFTEIPTPVEVGRWQIESDLGTTSWDRRTVESDGASARVWSLGATLVSTGIASSLDMQLGLEPYLKYTYNGPGGRETYQGRGDTYLRAKWNFLGDETKGPAVALLPYLKIPTARSGLGSKHVAGGLIIPFGMPLGERTSLNAMFSADWVEDSDSDSEVSVSASAVMLRRISEQWGVYAETTATVDPSESGDWAGTAGCGITWACTSRLTWDLAGYAAVTKAAPDWSGALRLVWFW